MADFVFNCSKGRVAYYASLPAANDGIVIIALEATGLETDATLKDYDDVASLLAGSTNEQTTAARKVLTTGITVTVDDTNDRVDIDAPDQVYTALTGNPIGALLFAYDPDTTTGTDSTLIPLTKHDFAVTPDGTDLTVTITNFARAS